MIGDGTREDRLKAGKTELKQNMRQKLEMREHEYLSPYASFSDNSKGRDRYEEPCDIRPIYQRDRDRILHSKSFRRLKHKTQVFLAPEGDHYRTRLTHTLEVTQNARTIARALRLNEDLTEAIALGHDLGHTPFGHAGERALNKICPDGFEHHKQSIRVVELLDNHGKGLNLTKEVRDGILNHQTKGIPSTLEGKIVRLSDKIAYINHDIDDAIRGHIITEDDIPPEYTKILGYSSTQRLNTLIHDIISNSENQEDIVMSPEVEKTMFEMRRYMFCSVYTNPVAKGEEQKAEEMVAYLFEYYTEHLELLPEEYLVMIENQGETAARVVCDYIAGMTDRFAVAKFKELTIPRSWSIY
ncbi:deoxyguanosinetriphosphate triphosphohydrolase-like protein [Anaerocolumna cellulosilytica]|uniref:Deoxyguanosinetriphosphate triphosphohydrolase-like protein n=2 Tax=Anaerocolumna cellulosilytica TaxID=433286 RepID=A0A6S6QZR6_9FIRM|nr:dGTPase [Anaerocolumna cellulosilytica]BCJ93347.1 deoxyguanosinetriphosphate triphosphohydrolase-like protein [Anaerocolumna cellulosilytica]